MPLYEYACQACHADFELLIRGADEPVCPTCGSRELAKQFSVPAAHTAGSSSLPVCGPPSPAGCGLPQCGQGICQGGFE